MAEKKTDAPLPMKKTETGRDLYRFMALYEDKRLVPPGHYGALMILGERGCVEVEEDEKAEKLKAVLTEKGKALLDRVRLMKNPYFYDCSPI